MTEEQKELLKSLDILEISEYIENPYTGQGCTLNPIGVALYDYIKGCELLGLKKELRFALDFFVEMFPNEYYILLD